MLDAFPYPHDTGSTYFADSGTDPFKMYLI